MPLDGPKTYTMTLSAEVARTIWTLFPHLRPRPLPHANATGPTVAAPIMGDEGSRPLEDGLRPRQALAFKGLRNHEPWGQHVSVRTAFQCPRCSHVMTHWDLSLAIRICNKRSTRSVFPNTDSRTTKTLIITVGSGDGNVVGATVFRMAISIFYCAVKYMLSIFTVLHDKCVNIRGRRMHDCTLWDAPT